MNLSPPPGVFLPGVMFPSLAGDLLPSLEGDLLGVLEGVLLVSDSLSLFRPVPPPPSLEPLRPGNITSQQFPCITPCHEKI